MKMRLFTLILFSILISCNTGNNDKLVDMDTIIFQPQDKEVLDEVFKLYSSEKDLPISELLVKVGKYFLDIPYVAHTLEFSEEQLVINLRGLDCTTFTVSTLAISRAIKSGNPTFEQFATEVQRIRYRKEIIDGYTSRIHYFMDWIYLNENKGLVTDISEEIAQTRFHKEIDFMTTHSDSYTQLKENPELIPIIAEQEKELSAREMYYIPEKKLAELEDLLMDGDIVGITTKMDGIAIAHVGILVRIDDRIHLMHASSKGEKVIISERTLEDYLLDNEAMNGVMVVRAV